MNIYGANKMVTRKRCGFCQHDEREELQEALEQGSVNCDDLDKNNNWRSGTAAQHQRNHMGDYVNSSNPKCALCTDPMRKHYEVSLSNGDISSDNIAEALETTKEQVQRHMKHHLAPLVQESAAVIIAKKEVNEIDLLSANIQRLDSKLNDLFNDIDLEPREIDSLTKLAKEVRESLKYLMEFKGKLIHKRQDTIIFAQMQVVQEVLAENNPQIWLDIKKRMQEKLQ